MSAHTVQSFNYSISSAGSGFVESVQRAAPGENGGGTYGGGMSQAWRTVPGDFDMGGMGIETGVVVVLLAVELVNRRQREANMKLCVPRFG